MDGQARIIDLVPRRFGTIAWIFLAGCGVVAGLELLYAVMPALVPLTTDGRVATFDLDGEGSLAVWFSTFTLTLASGMALVVASLCRERQRGPGSRRLWLWAAACWMAMGIDECASVHEAFKEMMSHATGHRLLSDGVMWWVLAYFGILGATGLRLLWSMRSSLGSAAALLSTAGLYSIAVLAEMGWILPEKNMPGVMLEEGCEMVGNLCLLLSMTLYARHLTEGRAQQRRNAQNEVLLCEPALELRAAGRPRERDHVADVAHPAHELDHSLQAQTEA